MRNTRRVRREGGGRLSMKVVPALLVAMALVLAACGNGDDPGDDDAAADDTADDTADDDAADDDAADDDAADDDAADDGEQLTLRFGYEGPEGTNQRIASEFFEEAITEVSSGAMEIQSFGGGQLGSEPELLEQVQAGTLSLVNSSTANAAILNEASGVFSFHYLFESPEHQIAALTDPEVVRAYADMMDSDNVKVLTLYTLPLRHMYSDGIEVRHPDDLAGASVRVQATRTEEAFFGAYGAQTVNMAFPELYSALQTGVVDFAENAITYYGASNHFEVAPTMSMTQHAGNTQVIWVSRAAWDDLSEQQQEWLQAAADEVNAQAVQSAFDLEDELRSEYEAEGVEFIEDVDREAFQELAEPVFEELLTELGDDAARIVELIRGHL